MEVGAVPEFLLNFLFIYLFISMYLIWLRIYKVFGPTD